MKHTHTHITCSTDSYKSNLPTILSTYSSNRDNTTTLQPKRMLASTRYSGNNFTVPKFILSLEIHDLTKLPCCCCVVCSSSYRDGTSTGLQATVPAVLILMVSLQTQEWVCPYCLWGYHHQVSSATDCIKELASLIIIPRRKGQRLSLFHVSVLR